MLLQELNQGDRVLDRYRVVARVASGGLSVVYRGVDERLPRDVCIKVFHALSKNCGTEEVYRASYDHFIQEAYALSQLGHPNTLRIYDFGYIEGPGSDCSVPVQVSEYMNGGTLQDVVRRNGPLRPSQALRVVTSLAGALGEAHAVGIVHRDLKPKNILFASVAQRQMVKLADFGIARPVPLPDDLREQGDPCACRERTLMYSLNWAAPEQLAAEPATPAADIHSLGLVLLYMLTGRMLFRAGSRAEALEQRGEVTERLAAIAVHYRLPAPLAHLLRQTCAASPAARPQGVEELVEALHGVLGSEGTSERRIQPLLAIDGNEGTTQVRAARPLRLQLGDEAAVGSRGLRFVAATPASDWTVAGGARVRTVLLPDVDGRFCLHIKGINCFVRLDERPPSSAVQVKSPGRLTLLSADRRVLARCAVDFGQPAAGHSVFQVDQHPVAIDRGQCRWVVGVDFGPGEDYRFLYAPIAAPDEAPMERQRW